MLVCVAVFAVAGVWQIQRGQAKQRMLTQRAAASKTPARPLTRVLAKGSASAPSALYGQDFEVTGHYDSQHQILLANQIFRGRVGYRVWTPLILADGRRVLVDRGWVPMASGGRDDPPTPPVPQGKVSVEGLFKALPKPGIRLGPQPSCQPTVWPRVLNYPTIETVRCLYGTPVIGGLILLSEAAPHGFARNWQRNVGMPPMRHYGYAVQWFAMAVAVVVVFVVVNMKRLQ